MLVGKKDGDYYLSVFSVFSVFFTIQLTDCCFSVCNVASLRLEIDGANRGCRTIRLESSLSQIDHLLKVSHDPIEFMCQAIGINPSCKSKLDEALAKQVVQNMPKSGFQLLNGSQLLNESAQPKGKQSGSAVVSVQSSKTS